MASLPLFRSCNTLGLKNGATPAGKTGFFQLFQEKPANTNIYLSPLVCNTRMKQNLHRACTLITRPHNVNIMKIIHTKEPVAAADIKQFLERELPPQFKLQRHSDIDLTFTESPTGLQISQPDLYEDWLFTIELVSPEEIHITKSEHYTDDVNVLTLEDIMNNLFLTFPGRQNIDQIAEES